MRVWENWRMTLPSQFSASTFMSTLGTDWGHQAFVASTLTHPSHPCPLTLILCFYYAYLNTIITGIPDALLSGEVFAVVTYSEQKFDKIVGWEE